MRAEAIYDNFVLDSSNASGYASWANSSDPDAPSIFMDYYLYNITNKTELIEGGKPYLQEVLICFLG